MWLSWMLGSIPGSISGQAWVVAQSPVGGSQEAADGCSFFTLMCHLMHTTNPNTEPQLASPRGRDTFQYLCRRRKRFLLVLLVQPMGDYTEKSLFFKLSVSPNGLLVYNSPSKIYKKAIFLFCSLDLHMVCYQTSKLILFLVL